MLIAAEQGAKAPSGGAKAPSGGAKAPSGGAQGATATANQRVDNTRSAKPDSQKLQFSSVTPLEVEPGGIVEISNVLFVEDEPKSTVENYSLHSLSERDPGCDGTDKGIAPAFQRIIRIPIPREQPSGLYRALICKSDGKKDPTPFMLVPIRVMLPRPELTSVHFNKSSNTLELQGRHLDTTPSMKYAFINCPGEPSDLVEPAYWSDDPSNRGLRAGAALAGYGACRVKVENADGVLSNELPVTLPQQDWNGPYYAAALELVPFLLVIAFIAYVLGKVGGKKQKTAVSDSHDPPPSPNGPAPGAAAARPPLKPLSLLVDGSSRRLSFSRLQLLVWAIPVVWTALEFGWLNGSSDAMPNSILVLFLLSVLTAGCGSYLNYLRSSDGPSQMAPSPGDLFAEFGQVIWERVFFSFCSALTLCYLAAICAVAVYNRTETLLELPVWLIAVNCLAALLFLLGKAFRSPGPQIVSVHAQGRLELTVSGGNLSPDATFFIDGKAIRPDLIMMHEGMHKPEILEDDYRRRGYARVLRLELSCEADSQWMKGPHELTVRNPNGQTAVCGYQSSFGIITTREQPGNRCFTITCVGFDDYCVVEVTNDSGTQRTECAAVPAAPEGGEILVLVDVPPLAFDATHVSVRAASGAAVTRPLQWKVVASDAPQGAGRPQTAPKSGRQSTF